MSEHIISKTPADLIESLSEFRDQIKDIMVVFSRHDGMDGRELCIGLSQNTDLSWFLKAKEWATWLLYRTMSSYQDGLEELGRLEQGLLANRPQHGLEGTD